MPCQALNPRSYDGAATTTNEVTMSDPFNARATLSTPLGERAIYRLDALKSIGDVDSLPYSIKVLLEAALRNHDGHAVTDEDIRAIASYDATKVGETEIAFSPGRVVLQDFTGVPAIVDLAAMRSAVVKMTGDESAAQKVNPLVPCDLVIDHSVQVDAFNSGMALLINAEIPEVGPVGFRQLPGGATGDGNRAPGEPRIPGEGGVGQRHRALSGQPGRNRQSHHDDQRSRSGWMGRRRNRGRGGDGRSADLHAVAGGDRLQADRIPSRRSNGNRPGLEGANRATIANMAPEYGATMGFFPVDEQTTRYLRLTGRDEDLVATVEQYYREQGLWREDEREIVYSSTIELDMGSVVPALAGPKRPQDRIELSDMKSQWHTDMEITFGKAGDRTKASVESEGQSFEMSHGDVVVAAITSCTNTSNPDVMVGAGLVARRAREKGLTRKPWVKTSLAPGSTVVTEYLTQSGLLEDLEATGFFTVGYGCTTCIGNSGPLPDEVSKAINEADLVAASVLSGNRNFEGRINPDVQANYLASPPLVVAYALAGTVDIDLISEPLGRDRAGNEVFLADIWPTQTEVDEIVAASVTEKQFRTQYADVFKGPEAWQAIDTSGGALYSWDASSTYVQEPPFFAGLTTEQGTIGPIEGARVLAKLGDSVTTDHISPAGSIAPDSPAGVYLTDNGVTGAMFNSYGSRRGNDRVMTRGTFANIRVRNQLAPGTEGGWTTDFTDGEVKSIYEASLNYKKAGVPLVVLGGIDYGMGSSRDWAAKGTFLLGARAVIAKSFERIHRSNLIGMGVLPLEFPEGMDADSLGLDGTETFDIAVDDSLQPRQGVPVTATKSDGSVVEFTATCRIDTPVEVDYYRNGGILHTVLKQMAQS